MRYAKGIVAARAPGGPAAVTPSGGVAGRNMRRTLVLNPKGGCGKTTIATNMAAYFAQRFRTSLLDFDPQASSSRWLERRPPDRPQIDGVRAYEKRRANVTRAWVTHNPDAERTVIDAPAAVASHQLLDMVRDVDAVVIPVLPSPIDIQATADFIRDLLLEGRARAAGVRIGVVANRVRTNTRIYRALERFLASLNLPFITTLRDTQNYVRAAEQGVGIHEMRPRLCQRDLEHWAPLIHWLEQRPVGNVTPIRPQEPGRGALSG